jgi:hypothetical protein
MAEAPEIKGGSSKPARDFVLVFVIVLAEVCLQCALLYWHSEKIEERARNQECNQDCDAPVKDDPPKQERQYGEIRRVTRKSVGTARQQITFGNNHLYALRRLGNVQGYVPDEPGGSDRDRDQPE